jgi:cob(I)alamin adenosyltransferase
MSMKVYTKTGDKGTTSLLGGSKVPKSNDRIAAYGNIDELNAFIGYLHDQDQMSSDIQTQLGWIQDRLFTLGSLLAVEPNFKGFELPQIHNEDITTMENWIDTFEEELPELKNFILPRGHKTISLCHVCRTVCRRAERSISGLEGDETNGRFILPFVNRLSDYLFVLSRKLTKDLQVQETRWEPRKS